MKTFLLALTVLVSPSWAEEFVLVAPGSFPRGQSHGRFGGLTRNFPLAIEPQFYGDSELPPHTVFITKPFYIGKTEVSVSEFREFVEATGFVTDAEKSGTGIVGWSPSEYGEGQKAPDWSAPRHDFLRKPEFTWRSPGFPQDDNHPVVGVSWNDARAYCEWRSSEEGEIFRLPTEAEWEMAAKAGMGDRFFHWGDEAGERIHEFANIGNVELEKARHLAAQRHWLFDVEAGPGDGHVFTAPVGSFEANAWGLHDMSGNVLEWCQDYFNFNFYDHWKPESGPNPVAVDPLNASEKDNDANEFRVARGGSWYTGLLAARSSARNYFDAPEAAAYIGFRIVKEPGLEEVASYSNPHADYMDAIRLIEESGGNFRPENGKATLSFRNEVLSAEVIEAIATIPGLHRIRDLRMEPWTSEAWNTISRKEGLVHFTAQGEDMASLDFSTLSSQPDLMDLHLDSPGLTDANLRQMAGTTGLQRLFFSGDCRDFTDEGMEVFAKNRKLGRISLYDCTLTGTFIEAYGGSPYLLSLWIGYREGEGDDSKGWSIGGSRALVETIPELRILTLHKQPMDDGVLEPLFGLDQLEELNLGYCGNLTDAGISRLLKEVDTVEKVTLDHTLAAQKCVALVPELSYLRILSIEGAGLSDSDMGFLARGKCLHEISLRHGDSDKLAKFTARGISRLGENPTLKKLEIESPVVLGAGIAGLAASPSLEEITVPLESMSDELVDVITSIPTMKKVNLRTRDQEAFDGWKAKLEESKPILSVNRR